MFSQHLSPVPAQSGPWLTLIFRDIGGSRFISNYLQWAPNISNQASRACTARPAHVSAGATACACWRDQRNFRKVHRMFVEMQKKLIQRCPMQNYSIRRCWNAKLFNSKQESYKREQIQQDFLKMNISIKFKSQNASVRYTFNIMCVMCNTLTYARAHAYSNPG